MAQCDIIQVLRDNSPKHMTAEEITAILKTDRRIVLRGLRKLYPTVVDKELIEEGSGKGGLNFRWWLHGN